MWTSSGGNRLKRRVERSSAKNSGAPRKRRNGISTQRLAKRRTTWMDRFAYRADMEEKTQQPTPNLEEIVRKNTEPQTSGDTLSLEAFSCPQRNQGRRLVSRAQLEHMPIAQSFRDISPQNASSAPPEASSSFSSSSSSLSPFTMPSMQHAVDLYDTRHMPKPPLFEPARWNKGVHRTDRAAVASHQDGVASEVLNCTAREPSLGSESTFKTQHSRSDALTAAGTTTTPQQMVSLSAPFRVSPPLWKPVEVSNQPVSEQPSEISIDSGNQSQLGNASEDEPSLPCHESNTTRLLDSLFEVSDAKDVEYRICHSPQANIWATLGYYERSQFFLQQESSETETGDDIEDEVESELDYNADTSLGQQVLFIDNNQSKNGSEESDEIPKEKEAKLRKLLQIFRSGEAQIFTDAHQVEAMVNLCKTYHRVPLAVQVMSSMTETSAIVWDSRSLRYAAQTAQSKFASHRGVLNNFRVLQANLKVDDPMERRK